MNISPEAPGLHPFSTLTPDMVLDALASVQFQDVTRQQIEHVIAALSRLDGHAVDLARYLKALDAPGQELRPLSEHLQEVYSGYVMHTQRSDHHSAVAAAASAGASGAVKKPVVPAPAAAAAPDNEPKIELF